MTAEKSALHWYPMRVTYNRELKVKAHLDSLNIENFLPMHYDLVETSSERRAELVPAIHNLIFVHSSQEIITELKIKKKELEPLRYMMKKSLDGKREIMHIPDNQMDNFMKVASVEDGSVMFLQETDYLDSIGKEVEITAGHFKGVRGVIKRIKKNKHVVVQIEGIAAVAITYIPATLLKEVS